MYFVKAKMDMVRDKSFTITKKIAKHGKQAVVIIPTFLQEQLSPGKLVEIKIEIKN